MSGIGNFLNNLGNSGIGAGLPQGGSGAGGFLDSLLGSFQAAHQAAQAGQQQRAEQGQYQRAAANQQIAQNVAIAKSNPALQHDPKFMAHMQQLSKQAGLPDPVQTTPGTPAVAGGGQPGASDTTDTQVRAQPAGLPTESLNMGILAPKRDVSTMDPKLVDDILGTPVGPQREAKMAEYDVPDSWHTVHAVASEADKKAMYKQFGDTAKLIGAGKMNAAGAAASIQPFVQQAIDMGLDPNALAAQYVTDAAAGPEVAASISKMQALGYKDDQIGAFEHMKTVEEPERFAEAVRVAAQNANSKTTTAEAATTTAGARVTAAATGQQNAITNANRAQWGAQAAFINARAHVTSADAAMLSAQSKGPSGQNAAMVQLKTAANALQADNNNVTKQISALLAVNGDPSLHGPKDPNTGQAGPSLFDQQLSLQGKLRQVTDQMFQITQTVDQQPTNNLRATMGNPSAQIGDAPVATNDQRGRFQITPQGVLDTSTGTFTPRNAGADPSVTQHADAANPNKAKATPPAIPAVHSDSAIPPKEMPSGLVADFKGWTPAQRLGFLQNPKVPTDVKAYLKTLIPPPKADPAAQPRPQQTAQPQQSQKPADPWAQVDKDRAGAQGSAGNWLTNTMGAISRQMGVSGAVGPGGATPSAPTASPKIQTPEVQGMMSKDAMPVVATELAKGTSPQHIVEALVQHGLTKANASKVVMQARLQNQQQPGVWGGGSQGNGPFSLAGS
jgi:hypothetical protein